MILDHIPFNRVTADDQELSYIQQAINNGHLTADGPFTNLCTERLRELTGGGEVLLVQSCTAALELSAILAGIGPGDEVIMPSFTFPSTANAVVLRGATPVFVDIREDTLNLDERLVADAITEQTRAILPVHYAGVGCNMQPLMDLAKRHGLVVIEDAAQGLLAYRDGKPLGSAGHLAAFSFHETKNISCGEGGALIINDPELVERAEIVREKGTDRSRFVRGQVDKYTWVDIGSSYALSDLNAAFLWGQLHRAEQMTRRRLEIWEQYHCAFAELEEIGAVRRPIVPDSADHNAHMYYLLLDDQQRRDEMLFKLNRVGINAVFHYIPLHSAPAGVQFGRAHGSLEVTNRVSRSLIRLPMWPGMTNNMVNRVCEVTAANLSSRHQEPAQTLETADPVVSGV